MANPRAGWISRVFDAERSEKIEIELFREGRAGFKSTIVMALFETYSADDVHAAEWSALDRSELTVAFEAAGGMGKSTLFLASHEMVLLLEAVDAIRPDIERLIAAVPKRGKKLSAA